MGRRGPIARPAAVSGRGRRKVATLTIVPVSVDAPLLPAMVIGRKVVDPHSETVATWLAFWSSPVASAVDVRSDIGWLNRWIAAVDEWHGLQAQLREEPIVEGFRGVLTVNPLHRRQSYLERLIETAEKRFGMDPESRARLGLTIGQAKLTAADLNRRVNDHAPTVIAPELASEWESA